MFGSDYPFGDPVYEKEKILSLDLPEAVNQAILAGNWLRLLAGASGGEGHGQAELLKSGQHGFMLVQQGLELLVQLGFEGAPLFLKLGGLLHINV